MSAKTNFRKGVLKLKFGRNFRRFRLLKGKSTKELSDYLEITEREYIRWEAGESEPDIPQLCAMARYYDCSTDLLLDMF